MRAAATATRADGNGVDTIRKRDIGIGGGQARHRFYAEMGIHGADYLQDARISGQGRRRTVADILNMKADFLPGGWIGLRSFCAGRSHGLAQASLA